jgi:hypothetical protein
MSVLDRTQREPHTGVDEDALDAAVAAFEVAWQTGDAPDIRSFVDAALLRGRGGISLLHELIRVDLEYRWKSTVPAESGTLSTPRRRGIEDYLDLLPEVGAVSRLPLDLIAEEYRVRHRWGDRPAAAEFVHRFPERAAELAAALAAVDRELEREIEKPPAVDAHAASISRGLAEVPQFDYRDFVLEAHLGSGGIGKVYRAWWKSRREYVAIKMLRKNWWRQAGADELFFREAAILVELKHPHIVRIHGIGRTPPGGCFLVMELMEDGDLSQKGVVPISQAIEWVAQAADGLAFAHRRGVVHRDVKPSNLLLDRRGGVRVADFGLALATAVARRGEDGLIGTAAFMAPEQLLGAGRQAATSDIFSLGAVLYTLLTGQPPYDGQTTLDVLERRLSGAEPANLRLLRPDVPESVAGIVDRCLAPEPSERFATAEELAGALRNRAGEG